MPSKGGAPTSHSDVKSDQKFRAGDSRYRRNKSVGKSMSQNAYGTG